MCQLTRVVEAVSVTNNSYHFFSQKFKSVQVRVKRNPIHEFHKLE